MSTSNDGAAVSAAAIPIVNSPLSSFVISSNWHGIVGSVPSWGWRRFIIWRRKVGNSCLLIFTMLDLTHCQWLNRLGLREHPTVSRSTWEDVSEFQDDRILVCGCNNYAVRSSRKREGRPMMSNKMNSLVRFQGIIVLVSRADTEEILGQR
jgi:hypothetical protein